MKKQKNKRKIWKIKYFLKKKKPKKKINTGTRTPTTLPEPPLPPSPPLPSTTYSRSPTRGLPWSRHANVFFFGSATRWIHCFAKTLQSPPTAPSPLFFWPPSAPRSSLSRARLPRHSIRPRIPKHTKRCKGAVLRAPETSPAIAGMLPSATYSSKLLGVANAFTPRRGGPLPHHHARHLHGAQ